jgi:2-methylcitrate dehydratase PrpD
MDETQRLVQKCHELDYDLLSTDEIDRVRYLFLDYLGVAARGSLYDSSRPPQNLARSLGANSAGAVVIGTDLKTSPPLAALANGIAAHAPELDDVVNEASLHPGVVVMSAVLSASHLSDASARSFIEAIVVGYEVCIRVALSLSPSAPYERGFHPTGTCGTMGAAVAAAKILKLNPNQMVNALGIAGSQAAGSMEFLADGSHTKRFNAGWAAQSGVMAALLARDGFTGPRTILEGKHGFLHAYATASNPDRLLSAWAKPYHIMKTSIKPYSCCRYKQGAIDCILKIMQDNGLRASDVEKATLGILSAGFPLVAEPLHLKQNPKSIVDAQFSMPFGAAVAILYGNAALDEYVLDNIQSPRVKALMEKISCVTDSRLDEEFPEKWPAWANILTTSGQTYSAAVDYPKGDPENPLTWDELIEKFNTLVAPIFSAEKRIEIIDRVQHLDLDSDLEELFDMLSA